MAGLCEGGNEPPGSLKASMWSRLSHLEVRKREKEIAVKFKLNTGAEKATAEKCNMKQMKGKQSEKEEANADRQTKDDCIHRDVEFERSTSSSDTREIEARIGVRATARKCNSDEAIERSQSCPTFSNKPG
ncbi:hypothetical protein ANN_06476 [Periplaneta americana]|uniref:Uncharacterized protein n=1 Tax=Periplaneta americana TaxID=6978 RepID=A0ABQ8TFD5_PERAM|nr:hypothetical protein ANN_06476 [Periplaneta americana]